MHWGLACPWQKEKSIHTKNIVEIYDNSRSSEFLNKVEICNIFIHKLDSILQLYIFPTKMHGNAIFHFGECQIEHHHVLNPTIVQCVLLISLLEWIVPQVRGTLAPFNVFRCLAFSMLTCLYHNTGDLSQPQFQVTQVHPSILVVYPGLIFECMHVTVLVCICWHTRLGQLVFLLLFGHVERDGLQDERHVFVGVTLLLYLYLLQWRPAWLSLLVGESLLAELYKSSVLFHHFC